MSRPTSKPVTVTYAIDSDAIMGRRRKDLGVRARSVIPGRQRWDIGVVLGRPRVAELMEAGLLKSPGVGAVRANPVTGRLLIQHDTALSGEEVDELVREAVSLAVLRATTLTRSPRPPEPSVVPAQVRHRRPTRPSFALSSGSAAVALALTRGRFLRRSPLVRLGAVVLATVAVVRRAWRRSRRSQQASAVSLRSTRHPLLHIVGPHKRQFYSAAFLSVLGQILDMLPALLVGWMASVLITGKSAALVRLGLTSASGQLWFLAGVTALVCIASVAVAFIAGVLWRNLAQSVQHKWRTEMYAHVQRVELRYLEGERTTRVTKVLTDDINQLGRFFASSTNNLVQLGASFLFVIPVFLFFAPGFVWIAFLPVPVIAWLSFFYQEHVTPDYATSGEKGSLLNSQLINNLEASGTIKSFGAEEYEINRIHRLSEAYRQSNRRVDTHTTALGRVLHLRSLPVESGGSGRRLEVAKVRGEMVLDGVTFAYPGRPPVLQNLSLRIAAGKTTGIVGVTGAGKTTIAKLLLRFQDVASGRVLLDGVDIREMRLQDLRNSIGFVGQGAFLFDGTVRDNIRYGSFDAGPERVTSAAQLAEADEFVDALPSQYDTMVGERGATLSGGQKQRISLARAILKSAPWSGRRRGNASRVAGARGRVRILVAPADRRVGRMIQARWLWAATPASRRARSTGCFARFSAEQISGLHGDDGIRG